MQDTKKILEEKQPDKIIVFGGDCSVTQIPFDYLSGKYGSKDSDNCHSNVAGGIYNLREKIEPDSKNPVYIKTVLGVGYKFSG